MVMMAVVVMEGLQALRECREGVLGARGIVRLQCGLQRLKIFADLTVGISQRGSQRSLGIVLNVLLKGGQGSLGAREISGLDGARQSLKILDRLVILILNVFQKRVCGRTYTGYA